MPPIQRASTTGEVATERYILITLTQRAYEPPPPPLARLAVSSPRFRRSEREQAKRKLVSTGLSAELFDEPLVLITTQGSNRDRVIRPTDVTANRFGYFGIRAWSLQRYTPSTVTLELNFHVSPDNGYFLSFAAFTCSKPTLTSRGKRVEDQTRIPFISTPHSVSYESAIRILCLDTEVF